MSDKGSDVSDRMGSKDLNADFGTRPREPKKNALEAFHEFTEEVLEIAAFINRVPVYESPPRCGYSGGMTILRYYA